MRKVEFINGSNVIVLIVGKGNHSNNSCNMPENSSV